MKHHNLLCLGGTAGQGELLRKGSSTGQCLLSLWKEKLLCALVQLFWMEDIILITEKSICLLLLVLRLVL